MGNTSTHTRLRISNRTSSAVVDTRIFSVDSYDWDGGARPDRNMQGRIIPVNDSIEEREEVNAVASNCPFKMQVYLEDGRKFTYSIHQKYAIGCCSGFWHDENNCVEIDYRQFNSNGLEIIFKDDKNWKGKREVEKIFSIPIMIKERKKDERKKKVRVKRDEEEKKRNIERMQNEEQDLKQNLEQLQNEARKLDILIQAKRCCNSDDHTKAAKIIYTSKMFDENEAKTALDKCDQCRLAYLSLAFFNNFISSKKSWYDIINVK